MGFTTRLKNHLIRTTAMASECNPIFALFEVGVAGMSNETSIYARLIGTGLGYLGMGFIYDRGRDKLKEVFKITKDSSEKAKSFFDICYGTTFSLAWTPILYAASGVRDLRELGYGVLCATVFGGINGFPIGYAIDSFNDLTSTGECNRKFYPNIVRKRHPHIKKGIAAGLAVASIGATGLIYSGNSYYRNNNTHNNVTVSQNLEGRIK